jgi:hypothetical protein
MHSACILPHWNARTKVFWKYHLLLTEQHQLFKEALFSPTYGFVDSVKNELSVVTWAYF